MENNEQNIDQDANTYASHKSVSQSLLNTSVIQGNIGLLVYVYANDKDGDGFGNALVILISVSLALQFIIFILLTILFHVRQTHQVSHNITATGLNSTVTALSGVVLVVNMAITAVSLEVKKED
jgi:hypothetical protein